LRSRCLGAKGESADDPNGLLVQASGLAWADCDFCFFEAQDTQIGLRRGNRAQAAPPIAIPARYQACGTVVFGDRLDCPCAPAACIEAERDRFEILGRDRAAVVRRMLA
jgi:hypothetical protein